MTRLNVFLAVNQTLLISVSVYKNNKGIMGYPSHIWLPWTKEVQNLTRL